MITCLHVEKKSDELILTKLPDAKQFPSLKHGSILIIPVE